MDVAISKRSLKDMELHGRRVLVRVDFNAPIQDGQVVDDTKIAAALPTINYLLDQNCRVILVSHAGRPKGRVVEELRLDPMAKALSKLLGRPVQKVNEVVGAEVAAAVSALEPGQILLLENVRFDPRETADDPQLAQELAALADVFVNDAFGSAHRAHASTHGVAKLLPSAAGLLMAAELAALEKLLVAPERPYWAIIGGAKVADKVKLLGRLLERCDGLIIGGGMANTFLAAQGLCVGASRVERELFAAALAVLTEARRRQVPILLPEDVVVADRWSAQAAPTVVPVDAVPDGGYVLDVGPKSVERFAEALRGARTVFWNGPLGVFEWPAFAEGTLAVAQVVAGLDAWTVVGGGDSVAAVRRSGVIDRIGHISTGGGASLEYLEGCKLPGVEALPAAETVESSAAGVRTAEDKR